MVGHKAFPLALDAMGTRLLSVITEWHGNPENKD